MKYKDFVKMFRDEINTSTSHTQTINNLSLDTKEISKTTCDLEKENEEMRKKIITDLNKKACDEMFEKIFGPGHIT